VEVSGKRVTCFLEKSLKGLHDCYLHVIYIASGFQRLYTEEIKADEKTIYHYYSPYLGADYLAFGGIDRKKYVKTLALKRSGVF